MRPFAIKKRNSPVLMLNIMVLESRTPGFEWEKGREKMDQFLSKIIFWVWTPNKSRELERIVNYSFSILFFTSKPYAFDAIQF